MGKKQEEVKKVDNKELEKLQNELDSVKELSLQLDNQLKRAVADYHNLEKRVAEGRSELTKWGTGELIKKLVPSLDHLDQAVKGVSESGQSSGWVEGVKLAVKELRKTLKDEGLDEIPADGLFDPTLHEAVDVQAGPENSIVKVVEIGYTLNGKVIKPSRVVVGRHSGEPQSGSMESDTKDAIASLQHDKEDSEINSE